MWEFVNTPLADGRGFRTTVASAAGPVSVAFAVQAWRNNADFRTAFNDHLAAAPYTAFRWETPAATTDTLTRPLEFVVLDSPTLDRPPEPKAFADHFPKRGPAVATFPNLGRNAVLIAPRPVDGVAPYTHLAAFVRHAPDAQRHELWRAVGQAMFDRVGDRPVWLSTAGGGVAWLHVRLDDSPKYYRHRPYQTTG